MKRSFFSAVGSPGAAALAYNVKLDHLVLGDSGGTAGSLQSMSARDHRDDAADGGSAFQLE